MSSSEIHTALKKSGHTVDSYTATAIGNGVVHSIILMYVWLCAVGSTDNILVDSHRKWTEGLLWLASTQ